MTLNELHGKLQDLTLGDLGEDLYGYLQKFFSMKETKESMLWLNQHQNYEQQVWRDGTPKPVYSAPTLEKREAWGFYIPSSKRYTAHETGELFRSMGVLVTPDSVAIVCTTDSSIAEDIDFMEGTTQVWGIEGDTHIDEYFSLYDPDGKTLGLTEESFATLRDDMVNSVLTQLKEYFNG